MISRYIDTAKLQAMLAALMSLVSCEHHDDNSGSANSSGDEPLGEMISCAVNNASVFGDDCRLERGAGGELVIHKPDGSFLRLRMKPGGTVETADGFMPATSHPAANGGVAVDVGEDHFVIPLSNPDDPQANPPADSGAASGGEASQ